MPQGPGTYGSKQGRPPIKKKKGPFKMKSALKQAGLVRRVGIQSPSFSTSTEKVRRTGIQSPGFSTGGTKESNIDWI